MLGVLFASVAVIALMPAPVPEQPVAARLPHVGERYGRVVIPRLDLRAPIVQGSAEEQLAVGVGHVVNTYLPGMGRTTALFAHRITPVLGRPYGPFRFINRLRRGDSIIVKMPYGRYPFRVLRHRVIYSTNWDTVQRTRKQERLVLAACHPPGSASYRYVVIAKPLWRQ
jgi:sortase A